MSLNPFGVFDAFGQQQPVQQPAAAPPIPPITQEEKQSLLEKLGSAGLGGLSAIAGILNKPGRIVRGALGGHFDELGNLIPFSDALGITNPEREVHGHELLRNLGVHDEADPSLFSPAGAAGFGVDVLTDPLTYLSFGGHALTKAGLAAKKAATLPATIAERAAQGLGGHVGIGLPFAGNAATFNLAPVADAISGAVRAVPGGNALADLTGNVAGAVGDLYNKTIPPLFQRSVRGQVEPIAQAEARAAEAARPGVQAAARARVGALTADLPSVAFGGVPTLEEGRQLRQAMEQVGAVGPTGAIEQIPSTPPAAGYTRLYRTEPIGADKAAIQKFQEVGGNKLPDEFTGGWYSDNLNDARHYYKGVPGGAMIHAVDLPADVAENLRVANNPEIAKWSFGNEDEEWFLPKEMRGTTAGLSSAVTGRRALQAENLQNLNKVGFPDLPLADQIGYAGRELTAPPAANDAFGGGAARGMRPAGQKPARDAIFKGLETEGPGSLNDLSRRTDLLPARAEYNAGKPQALTDVVKKDYLGVDPAELANLRVAKPVEGTAAFDRLGDLEARSVQAEHLADYVAKLNPKLAEQGLGMFDVHPDITLAKNTLRTANRVLDAQALHNAVAKMAVEGEGVPLSKVLTDAGLTYKDASGNLAAMQRTMEAMQKLEGKLPANATLADLDKFSIPADQASKLTKFTQAATAPAGLQPFLKIWDSITNLTKAFQTAIWPANRVRNGGQAVFQNWVHDGFNAQAAVGMGYVKPYIDAMAWHGGKPLEGISKWPAFQGMTDEVASKKFANIVDGLGVASAFRHADTEVVGGELAVNQLLPKVPGQARTGFGEIVKSAVPANPLTDIKQFGRDINPLGVAGFNGAAEDTNTLVKAGRNFGTEQHAVDRVATFAAKMSQGYTPEAALAEVNAAHYDFANMSDFEKSTMRRVIPFYNFMRQNVPAVVSELATNPGGKLATTIKGVNEAKGDHPGFVPSQISGGIAAKVGDEQNGQQRYLTHLGLGFEDLGNLAGPGALGMLNPLIKAPIEAVTGRQLITGRDLADLHSRIGESTGITPPPMIENLLMNSPVGRAFSTAGTLADDRKSVLDKLLNTATGVHVSDVAVDASRRRAVLDAITNQLHGPNVNHFDSLSVRPDQFQQMDPFQQHLYQLYRNLNSGQGRLPGATALQ